MAPGARAEISERKLGLLGADDADNRDLGEEYYTSMRQV
jgi:hypothetical protein